MGAARWDRSGMAAVERSFSISQEDLSALLAFCFENSKSHFENMFTSMATSIINNDTNGWENFQHLRENPAAQMAWLKEFREFAFSNQPCVELVSECALRFNDMRERRPELFQPQIERLRTQGGAGKALLEFCETFHTIHCADCQI